MPTNSHILKPDILRRTYNLSIPLTVMPVIQITISQGRSIQQKRELVKDERNSKNNENRRGKGKNLDL
jgi:hypothetical protein